MQKKALVSILMAIFLATAVFTAISLENVESEETEIALVRTSDEAKIETLETLGANVLHTYDAFTLVEIDPAEISQAERMNLPIDMMEHRSTIQVGEHEFDIRDGEPDITDELRVEEYGSGEKGQYIVHLIGPIASEWRDTIEDKDVEVMNYVHNYAYRVRMTPDMAERVEELDFVDWTGIYHPEYKLQPGLEPGTVNIRLVAGTQRDSIDEVIETVPIISTVELGDRGLKITAEVDSQETLHELARITDVTYISEQVEFELHDEMATQIVGGGTWFYPEDWETGDNAYRNPDLPGDYAGDAGSYINQVGYTGDGVVVAVADTGLGDGTTPDAGHDDFTGRVIGGYTFGSGGWEDGHGHGTHCSGSVAGDTYHGTGQGYGFDDYYAAQGSSPEAELYAIQIFENGGSVIPGDLHQIFEVAKQEAYPSAYVHSNSWGSTGGHGTYTEQSTVFDAAVRDANRDTDYNEPMVITGSAGNDGGTGVPPPASAKNIITVGATENYNSETDNPENIAGFSSRGPVDDNRIKPDVQAPGNDVYSTMPGNDYGYMGGTSMSNPAVAGAAAVVVEWFEEEYGVLPSPAMVKSILINTANPLDGDTEGPIPNGDEGWGMVDISKLQRPHDDPVSFLLEDQDSLLETGDVDEHTVGVENPDEPLKISLVWTDQEAPSDTGSGTALMNDLNLEVISPSGDVYHGNAFADDAGDQSTWDYTYANTDTMSLFDDSGDGWDDTNNVQNVYIHPDDLESGAYTINIEGFNVPEDANNDGTANQDYALTVYNAAEGPQIELENPEGGEYLEVGEEEEIIWNTDEGAGEITHVDLDYSVDGGSSWLEIQHNLTDDGSHPWTVPDDPTDQAVVRATVYDDDGEPGVDTSDEFTITDVTPPDVTLTSPVGGEFWYAGEFEDITWDTVVGDEPIEGVDIAYSTDGGDSWEYIIEGTDDTGEYNWEIPDETSSDSLVRVWVHCQGDTTDRDTSDEFDLIGYPPDPPQNLDVEYTSEQLVTVFEDDVSEDKGYDTWTSHAEASEWGIRDHGSSVGDQSWDWGDGEFNKDADVGFESRLISPEIQIPENPTEVELTFDHWRDFGDTSLYDAGNFKISVDDGDFGLVEPEEGYDGDIPDTWGNPLGGEPGWGGNEDWETATFDLMGEFGEDIGGSTIQLRWNAGTEAWDGLEGVGWRIDNINIEAVAVGEGEDDNLVTWDASPGDLGDLFTDPGSDIDGEQATSERISLEIDTLYETESTGSIENEITDIGNQPVEHEDGWYSLYGHAEDAQNEVEWRYDPGNAVGMTAPATWYAANVLDLSEQAGQMITDVAFYHTPLGAPPHLDQAQAYIGVDDSGAPAEPFLTGSEVFTDADTGWIELELDEPVQIDPNEDYWVVMEYEEGGDGNFPAAFIHEENDVEDPEDAYIESAHFMSDPDADPHDPVSWGDDYGQRGAFTMEVRLESLEDPFFVVEIQDYDAEVEPGEDITVDYTVTNLGVEEGTQDIEFFVDGTLEDTEESITLVEDQVYDAEFVWETDEEDLGHYDLLVASEDDVEEVTVMVGDTKPVSHYNIYRAEDQYGPWDNLIATVEADGSENYGYVDYEQAGEPYNWYVVRAVSEEGVEEQNEDAVPEPGYTADIFDISLETDGDTDNWNFVSFNLVPDDSELTEILDDVEYGIEDNYDKVMYFDSAADLWQSYIPGRDDHFNNLDNWDHTMGIWIQMNSDDTLTIEGSEPTSTDITLNPGWNMVSYPSAETAEETLPSDVTTVGYFDATEDNNIAYVEVDEFEFEPGQGYYLYAEEETTWTVDY